MWPDLSSLQGFVIIRKLFIGLNQGLEKENAVQNLALQIGFVFKDVWARLTSLCAKA